MLHVQILTLDNLARPAAGLAIHLKLHLLTNNLSDVLPTSSVLDNGDTTRLLLETDKLLGLNGLEVESFLTAKRLLDCR
jgi:hypothetical protein